MEQVKVSRWLLNIDIDETSEYYNNLDINKDFCSCIYCRNYIDYCKNISIEANHTFNLLGIQPTKAIRLSEYGEVKDKLRLYTGEYLVVGEIVNGPINTNDWDTYSFHVNNYTFFISNNQSHDDFQGKPTFILEFSTEIPWIIDEPPEV